MTIAKIVHTVIGFNLFCLQMSSLMQKVDQSFNKMGTHIDRMEHKRDGQITSLQREMQVGKKISCPRFMPGDFALFSINRRPIESFFLS